MKIKGGFFFDQIVADFLTEINAANDQADVNKAASNIFVSLGFEGAFYGAKSQQNDRFDVWSTPSLAAWHNSYIEASDYQRDPLFAYIPHMPDSFETGSAYLDKYQYLSKSDCAFIQRGADFGLTAGIAISTHFRDKDQIGGWNILSGHSRPAFEKILRQHRSTLLLVANLAHAKNENFATPSDVGQLSPRQAECLKWLSAGYRTNQIAWKMGIKPVTVDMHIRDARLRLGATTREQTLSIALTKNLISV